MARGIEKYRTISRYDAKFCRFMEGHLEEGLRPIPVRKIIAHQEELITFGLVSNVKNKQPSLGMKLFLGIRPEWLPMVWTPCLVAIIYISKTVGSVSLEAIFLLLISLMFFHGSVFLLNDYYDHATGLDIGRNNERKNHIIMSGWMPAYQVKTWGYLFFGIGAALGLPLLLNEWQKLMPIVGFGSLAILGYSYKNRGIKYTGLGEGLSFLCLGPFLTLGIGLSLGNLSSHIGMILIGLLFGYLSLLCLHFRHLETIFSDSKSELRTLVTRMGFDRSKSLGMLGIVGIVPLLGFVLFYLGVDLRYACVFCSVALVPVILFLIQASKFNSPFASGLRDFYKKLIQYQIAIGTVLILIIQTTFKQ